MSDNIFSQLIKKEDDERKHKKQYALNKLTVIFQFLTLLISLTALSFSVYPLLNKSSQNTHLHKQQFDEMQKDGETTKGKVILKYWDYIVNKKIDNSIFEK